ncbi:MAG: LTA synthase family protein, partial [Candidatus Nitrotoga sp.]
MSKFKLYHHSIIPHLPILVMLVMLAIFSLTRIGLGIYTGTALVDWHLWFGILAKGLWFDLSVIAILIAMVCLYEAALPNEWRASRWHGLFRRIFLWFVIALLLFGAVSEAVFWIEFSTRFNFIAVDYLLYTHEVISNIRESYPVGWILAGIGVTAAGIVWLLHHRVHKMDVAPISRTSRLILLAIALVAPVL